MSKTEDLIKMFDLEEDARNDLRVLTDEQLLQTFALALEFYQDEFSARGITLDIRTLGDDE